MKVHNISFCGYAFVANDPALQVSQSPRYHLVGERWLETPSIQINEAFIHQADNRALKECCRTVLQYQPLILHPCPIPFPVFKKGQRVKIIARVVAGETGTIKEDSGLGGMCTITLDHPRDYKQWGFNSIAVRTFDEVR